MPGSAHILFGLVVGLILYQATGKKFTPYYVVIFAFNNILGPDLGWIIPDWNAALFVHSAVGYGISLAFPLSAIFFCIGYAIDERLKFSDIYKIAVAGGFGHLFIDVIGHPNEPFVLLPRNETLPFLQSAAGVTILVGLLIVVISALISIPIRIVPTLENRFVKRLPTWSRVIVTTIIKDVLAIFLVVGCMGLLLLMMANMPFGSWASMTLPDIWTTGIWGPMMYGSGYSSGWITILSIGFVASLAITYRFLPNTTKALLLLAYVAFLFVVSWLNPNLGAGEAELGVQAWTIIWLAFPLVLLATSVPGITCEWWKFEYSKRQLAMPRFAIAQAIAFGIATAVIGVVVGYVLVNYPYEFLGPSVLILWAATGILLVHALLVTRGTTRSPTTQPLSASCPQT